LNNKWAITMPEKLLMPFTDKGNQVSLKFSGSETKIEIHNRKNSCGPTGTMFVTSVSGMGHIASGHQKGCTRSHVTTVWSKKWCAPSPGFRCPSRNAGNQWRREGLGKRVRWKWSQRLSLKGA